MERISQRQHYDYDYIMIMTLLDVKVILKVSVTDGKSLTSGEVRIHKYFCLYNTLFSLTCCYKIFSQSC